MNDVTKAARIGNSSGIDQEQKQLLNRESQSYAGRRGGKTGGTLIKGHSKWRQANGC